MKKITFLSITFLLLAYSQMYAQPVNNICSGAITLTVGATCNNSLVTIDVTVTGSGVPDPECSATYNGGDLWYKLVMPASGGVRVETDTDNGSITDGGMAIYTGADCSNSLTLYSCNDDGNTDSADYFERISVALPSGTTIYIRVWEYGGTGPGTFNICAYEFTPPPPATNDNCIDAIELTIGVACTPIIGTNSGATNSDIIDTTIPAPECASYLGGDIWFKLTVPLSGDLEIETYEDDFSIIDGGMAVYSGNCAPNGLIFEDDCDDDSGNITNENFERIELLDQTPGETLYVRIWAYENSEVGTFNICAVDLNPLSVPYVETNTFSMYPNPAKGIVNISFNTFINENSSIRVYDIQGKFVLEKNSFEANNTTQLDVSNLQSGMYFVKLKNEQKETVQKLIIN